MTQGEPMVRCEVCGWYGTGTFRECSICKLIAAKVAAEREACAKILSDTAEALGIYYDAEGEWPATLAGLELAHDPLRVCEVLAEAIRARGKGAA